MKIVTAAVLEFLNIPKAHTKTRAISTTMVGSFMNLKVPCVLLPVAYKANRIVIPPDKNAAIAPFFDALMACSRSIVLV